MVRSPSAPRARILVARPAEQARETAEQLEALGAQTAVYSTVEILPVSDFSELDSRLRSLSDYRWIVFSSPHGVDAFIGRLHALGLDGRALGRSRLAAVGPSVAAALDRWKLVCDLLPDADQDKWDAEHLAKRLLRALEQETLLSQSAQGAGRPRTLVVRADRGKTTIETALRSASYPVEPLVVYRHRDIDDPTPRRSHHSLPFLFIMC